MSAPPGSWELPLPARMAVAIVAVVVIVGGPVDRQVLGREDRWFKSWRPYGGAALDVCVAEYFVVAADGGERPVSRLRELHGVETWWQAPWVDRHLRSPKAVRQAGRELCRALGFPDLRVRARCAELVHGWTVVDDGSRGLCR